MNGWMFFATAIDAVVEKFGWPGLLVVFVMYMVLVHATDAQRHELIDKYLLGHGIGDVYPIIIMGGLFLAVLFSQRHFYRKKLTLAEAELARLGSEKSSQQEKALGARLHHSPTN